MAISQENAGRAGGQPSAPTFVDVVDVTLDNSYPVGGWPLDLETAVDGAGDLVLPKGTTILAVQVADAVEPSTGYILTYDLPNKLLKAWECNGATNPTAVLSTAAALDGLVVRLVILSH